MQALRLLRRGGKIRKRNKAKKQVRKMTELKNSEAGTPAPLMPLGELSRRLQDLRPNRVARATKLNLNTIIAIRDGKNTNPTYRVLTSLSAYFDAADRLNARGS